MTQEFMGDPRIIYLIGILKELGGVTWSLADDYTTSYVAFRCMTSMFYLYFDTRSNEIGRFSTGWQKLDFGDDNQMRQIIQPLVKYG